MVICSHIQIEALPFDRSNYAWWMHGVNGRARPLLTRKCIAQQSTSVRNLFFFSFVLSSSTTAYRLAGVTLLQLLFVYRVAIVTRQRRENACSFFVSNSNLSWKKNHVHSRSWWMPSEQWNRGNTLGRWHRWFSFSEYTCSSVSRCVCVEISQFWDECVERVSERVCLLVCLFVSCACVECHVRWFSVFSHLALGALLSQTMGTLLFPLPVCVSPMASFTIQMVLGISKPSMSPSIPNVSRSSQRIARESVLFCLRMISCCLRSEAKRCERTTRWISHGIDRFCQSTTAGVWTRTERHVGWRRQWFRSSLRWLDRAGNQLSQSRRRSEEMLRSVRWTCLLRGKRSNGKLLRTSRHSPLDQTRWKWSVAWLRFRSIQELRISTGCHQ